MKAFCSIKTFVIITIALLTIIFPNRQHYKKVKKPLIIYSLDISDSEVDKTLDLIVDEAIDHVDPLVNISRRILGPSLILEKNKQTNPSLNALYLGRSPPVLS